MKNILEIIPLLVFFITYKQTDLITATIALVIMSAISIAILAYKTKKIAIMPLVSASILGFFGFLTWYMQDPIFIKIKPTIINLVFGLAFIVGYFIKKPFFKYMLGEAYQMSDKAWLIVSLRWGIFFLVLAVINEFVWRSFSEEFWVGFKVFGFMPITILFTLSQLPFMLKHGHAVNK